MMVKKALKANPLAGMSATLLNVELTRLKPQLYGMRGVPSQLCSLMKCPRATGIEAREWVRVRKAEKQRQRSKTS